MTQGCLTVLNKKIVKACQVAAFLPHCARLKFFFNLSPGMIELIE